MTESSLAVHTIGQTPRPDLTRDLEPRFGASSLTVYGALDGLSEDQIPSCPPGGYPLETRLRDGTRVVVDAVFLGPRLQDTISSSAESTVHFILCAGWFPDLRATGRVVQPFDATVAELASRGIDTLEVVVPFAAQAEPAEGKWASAGLASRVHVLGEKPEEVPVAPWLAERLMGSVAEALVFDYVGYPATVFEEVAAMLELPVFDVGRVGLDALERWLSPGRPVDG